MKSPANFYLVGAAKAGTTSLCNYLGQHPQIYMSPVKEPNFFADEVRFSNFDEAMQRQALANPDFRLRGPAETWPDYLKLFVAVSGQTAIGEASASYLWSPTAPANIARARPDAKILMILRDPIDRAFAQYLHMLSFADHPVTFREHMDRALASTSKRIGELYPFLEYGLYTDQVKRYLDLFPRNQISIHFYKDYQQAPAAMMREVFAFLNVDPTFVPDMTERHMQARVPKSWAAKRWLKQLGLWNLARAVTPQSFKNIAFQRRETMKLEPEDRARLTEYYRRDADSLATLLNLEGGRPPTASGPQTG